MIRRTRRLTEKDIKFEGINKSIPQMVSDAFRQVAYPSTESVDKWYVHDRLLWDHQILQRHLELYQIPKDETIQSLSLERKLSEWINLKTENTLLVSGGPGVGKTTFIEYFFKSHYCSQELSTNEPLCYIRVDLGEALAGCQPDRLEHVIDRKIHQTLLSDFPQLNDVPTFIEVWDTVEPWNSQYHNQLRKSLGDKEFYNKHIEWISKQVEDLSLYNTARLKYLSSHGSRVVLFLDNIDTLPRKAQESVYLISRHKVNWVENREMFKIIIALREYTYRSFVSSNFDPGYAKSSLLYVSAPSFDKLLQKRADFMKSISTFDHPVDIPYLNGKLTFTDEYIHNVLRKLAEGLSNPATMFGILALADNNIRTALFMVNRCLSSPWIPWQIPLSSMYDSAETQSWLIPWNSVLRGIMAGSMGVFKSQDSPILNLFEYSPNGNHHALLLRCHTLDTLNFYKSLSLEKLLESVGRLGHSSLEAEEATRQLVAARLIESLENELFLTTSGNYYRDKLISSFVYLQMVALDTPIEEDLLSDIGFPNIGTISGNMQIVVAFLNHLARVEQEQFLQFRSNDSASQFRAIYGNEISPITSRICYAVIEEVNIAIVALKHQRANQNELENIRMLLTKLPIK